MHQFRAIEAQQRFSFLLIYFQTMTDDVEIGVVEPVFFERATLEALNEGIKVFTVQEKYRTHIQHPIEHLCLVQVARDSIQDEDIFLGVKQFQSLCKKKFSGKDNVRAGRYLRNILRAFV